MNEQISIHPNRFASHWRWFAQAVWLLVTLAALIILARGVPVFVENLQWTYRANFGFWVQRNSSNELFMVPDINGQAARVGVLERDVLLTVDGQPVGDYDVTALEQLIPVGTPGTAVTLQLRTGNRPVREVTLIRGDQAGAWLHRYGIPLAAVIGLAVGVELLVTLGFIASAAFIFWRRGQTTAVWLSSLVLILVFASAGSLPVQSLYFAEIDWQYGLDIWISLIVVGLILFLFLFPNGRFVPRWSIILLPLSLLWIVAAWVWPELYFWRLALQHYLPTMILILLVGLLAQLWRFRLVSDARERQQTKWVVWGTGVALTAVFIQLATRLLLSDSPLLFDLLINPLTRLLQLLIPVTLALAIVQHRLWDIDIILNRTLVYGGLTGLITAVYILLVGSFSALAVNQSGQIVGLVLMTALALVGFQPLHDRWQTAVNRLIPLPEKPPHRRIPAEDKETVPLTGRKQWLAWLSLGLGLLLFTATMAVTTLWGNIRFDEWYFQFTGPAFLIVGTIIILRRPANRIGRLCLLIGWLFILAILGFFDGAPLAPFSQAETLFPYALRIGLTLMQIATSLMFVYLPLLLPDGHYLNKHWRRFGTGLAILTAVPTLLTLIQPGIIFDWGQGEATTIANPLALNWPWLTDISQLTLIYLWGIPTILSILVAIGSLFLRWRQSEGEIRQQTKWIVYFLSTVVFSFITIELFFWLVGLLPFKAQLMETAAYAFIQATYGKLGLISWLGFPLVIGLAILRYRLFDIDIIINRTLVYGGLSLGIVVVYMLVVGALGALFQAQDNYLVALLATGLIAVLFQPVRERLQRGVNRLMYGERDDPTAVLSRLAQQLETADSPDDILPNLVRTIAHTLKLPHVAIWLPVSENKFDPVAAWGQPSDHVEMIPLIYQNKTIGQLVVAPRGVRETFNRRERNLLNTIAALTANTVRAVRLSNELRHSRQRIITAREEERRRLRRDLHDGLGPQLASQTLGLEAVEQLMPTNPQKAYELLASLKAQAQEAITDVRRLVYDLRPPTLDDLGLVGALKQSAARYENGRLQFTIDVPEPLPALPAAVETAVYRITQEAMTNIVRHAQATQATIRLTCLDQYLVVTICDNGQGLSPEHQSGVGLQSMRERAAELNGRCIIESNPEGGTRVEAQLPLGGIGD